MEGASNLTASPLPPEESTPPLQPVIEEAPLEIHNSETEFTVNAPETRVGRKRKAKDLSTMLEVCTCGNKVEELERLEAIQCKRAGCETGWVSVVLWGKNP